MDIQQSGSSPTKRDLRIDVLRGLALLMIFVDHIPGNALSLVTLRNFGFSDAAEIFVMLAGFSSMLAYGRAFQREGARGGLRRIARRLGRLYVFQTGLLLATLAAVVAWNARYHLQPMIFGPILNDPVAGLMHALTLHAVPGYLDILPLYIVLLAAFPLIYFGLRTNRWLTLGFSAALWLAANIDGDLNLPNWITGESWFFDPLAWQFLFTIGAALAMFSAANGEGLPRVKWLAWLCEAYLVFAFFEAAPWTTWGLPNLQPFEIPGADKTHLGVLRLLDMLALAYLVLTSARLDALARRPWLRLLEACGRHSLEVFAVGCILALFGRLVFRTGGGTIEAQILVNAVGLATMCLVGLWLERRRNSSGAGRPGPPAFIAAVHAPMQITAARRCCVKH